MKKTDMSAALVIIVQMFAKRQIFYGGEGRGEERTGEEM